MSNYIKSIPIKEKRVLVQARVAKKDYAALKKAKVKIPELIREACREAVKKLEGFE